ncbi:MAG: FAD-binding oxidoreductase [Promethearchaeota archaeon]
MIDDEIKERIISIVGENNFSDNAFDLLSYSQDGSEAEGTAEAIAWVTKTEQVSEIMKFANEKRFPVTPRGSGTGLSGGGVASSGLLMDFSRMNKIIEIDQENLTATVEAGVVLADLNKQLAKLKPPLFFPPMPASDSVAQIGGSIAENAGGVRAVKYGVMRRWVLGLEIVLPTGEILIEGGKTRKNVSGYDLIGILAGSEGTLGIITKATVSVTPVPETQLSALAYFDRPENAGKFIFALFQSGLDISAGEILDRQTLNTVASYTGMEFPDCGAMILIELDGDMDDIKRRLGKLEELFKTSEGILDYRLAWDPIENLELWRARKAALPSMTQIKPNVVIEDTTVSLSKIPELLKRMEELAEQFNIKIPCYGHIGDGNIHPMFLFDPRDPDEARRAHDAVKVMGKIVLKDLQGTVTGEHGVGTEKKMFMLDEHGQVKLNLWRRIKQAFDPNGILNPGKIFDRN